MRVAATFGPGAHNGFLREFECPGVELSVVEQLRPDDRYAAALIFGGDGSVHRQLAALKESRIPALVVAAGSGNDFARELGLNTPRHALAAWTRFVAGEGTVREIDLGVIREAGAGQAPKLHYFCCIAGAGLDSEANRIANRMPAWLRGHGGYILGGVRAILAYRFPVITVNVAAQTFSGSATFAVVANGQTYGDGMRMAPHAKLDDGLLDICFVHRTSKYRLLRFFHTVFAGRHLALHEVEYAQAACARLQSEPALDVYADGEYVCPTPVEITVARKALRVIV